MSPLGIAAVVVVGTFICLAIDFAIWMLIEKVRRDALREWRRENRRATKEPKR